MPSYVRIDDQEYRVAIVAHTKAQPSGPQHVIIEWLEGPHHDTREIIAAQDVHEREL